jgi:hypothetical protein
VTRNLTKPDILTRLTVHISTPEDLTVTALARIEANRRNGEHSTGPRTAEGKAVVSRNATKHGIFASVPVIPGESPATWEAHRAGVVESLAPVGLLEVNLAERAALLLWRLQRLARYEAETVAAAVVAADVPALPPAMSEFERLHPPPERQTRDEQLRDLRNRLRKARQTLAEVTPARDYLCSPSELNSEQAIPFGVAESILETAMGIAETAEDVRSDPPAYGGKAFLRKLDLAGSDPKAVAWTTELIRRALDLYAGYAGDSPERFLDSVRAAVEVWAEELARKVRRLEGQAAAVTALLDEGSARKQAAKLLPGDGRDERIAKYERHLHNLLTSTLHELERLQARRDGEAVPPPAVADVNVTVDAGAG